MASSKRLFTGCWSAGSECSAQAAPGSHKGEPHDPLASQLAALSISGATATVSISRAPSSSTMAKQQRIPRSSPGQHHQPAADQLLPEGDPNPRGKDSHHSPNTVLLAGSEASGSSGASTPTACSPLPPTTLRNDTTADSGPPPPSSYRRLWQAVSGVRRGGALPRQPGGGGSGPVKEVTVDSLVKAVMRARTGQPVVDAVKDGLYCLDGRAVAALLKELAKNGLQYAASELFDWLRQLPPTHPLARLVDVYTYTTIISQCGNHQQLRKALELVAEMRSKGVACNIHTFSALMSVCVKCNECELALDVYEQLLSEGCTPNMVTWNILIDIHSKSGNCEQAVAVLDEIRGQGLTLEARTYNSVITACSKTGQPMQALKVYERMLRDGVSPTGTTYTSLISAYGKAGQVEEALRVYEDMQQRGCECNVITYSSLISACERAGRYEVALQLFERMLREECRPNVVTYNSLIGACGQGGALDRAAEVFEHMVSHGCRPDAVTFSVLIAAYERGGEWGKALQTLERMQQHGFRPDACVYNCVLEALWSTGLAAAQAKAVQLLQFGCRQGHLRMHSGSGREVTAVAHTYAACLLVLLKWLADSRELMSSPPRPGSPLPLLALRLVKGKHCRSDQSYQPIQAALQRMCTAYAVPLTLLADEQGLLVQADPLALAAWRGSEQSRLLLQPLCHPLSMPLPSGTLLQSDALLQQQCGKAFAAVQEFEAAHSHSAAPGSHGPNSRGSLWQSMVDMIVTLAGGLQISEETTHDALQLCDRLLGSGAAVEEGEATAVAACVLLMTCKQVGEARTPDGALLFGLLGLPPQALGAAEERVLSALAGDTAVVSSLRVLQLFLERLGGSSEAVLSAQRQLVCYSTTQLLSKAALTPVFYQFPASAVAAACLHKAREGLGVAPAWPSALAGITRYDPAVPGDAMRECLDLLSVLGLAA